MTERKPAGLTAIEPGRTKEDLMTDLRTVYEDTYLAIRAKHGHPDEPIRYRGRLGAVETLPPKGWSQDQYAAYFDEVMRLSRWASAAFKYAAKKRKTYADRVAYLEACDRFNVAGHDLRFAGEPVDPAAEHQQEGLFS